MSIRSILFIFGGTESELFALNKAFALAKAYAAHLRILHVTPEITLLIEGVVENPAIIAAMEEDNKRKLNKAKEYTSHYAAVHQIPMDTDMLPLHHASAKFVHQTGVIENAVAKEGCLSDLILVGHNINSASELYDGTIFAALFNTGRPVMLIPQSRGIIPTQWHDKVITLAWNGSLEASRAIYNAMPILERAEKIHILYARGHKEKHLVTEEKALMDYMDAHAISSDVSIVDCAAHGAAESLLSKAVELGSDIMVMGAYGHTRFREMILGGVTNYMLEHSTIPLLLSH